MALDFQKIEAHTVDIENFDYDVSNLVDNIFVGPQGDLLEKIEIFNSAYGCNLGVTKSFTLKPGGYDSIKQSYNDWVLRHDMKPRGIKSLFDRIDQYRWRNSGFKNALLDIDTKMKNLKSSGMRWQDNTDQFQEEFNKLKLSIINALTHTKELYPNIDISCKLIPTSENRLQRRMSGRYYNRTRFPSTMWARDSWRDFVLIFYIKIQNSEMNVHVMDDSSRIDMYRIRMGDVIISSGTYLLPLLSRNWGRTSPLTGNASLNQYDHFLEAIYLSTFDKSEHPYISKAHDLYTYKLNSDIRSGNICTGNMEQDLRNSLLNNEIMAHVMNLITWVTNYYVPQTHPLNRIHKGCIYGDDLRFSQFRLDLNNSSTTVFRRADTDLLPHNCDVYRGINNLMYNYASNRVLNIHYNSFSSPEYSCDNEVFEERMEEYINMIDIKDAPCNNCS